MKKCVSCKHNTGMNPVCSTCNNYSAWSPREYDSPESNNAVNHPSHYGGKDNPYEAIKVIEAWNLGFNLGNTVKYISRAGKKNDIVEDLEKALWYLEREIFNLKNNKK